MKRILQIDGGGIMGVIPSTVLASLEEKLSNKPLCKCFDLITGTSTGAIIGGAIAAGVPAKEIASIYTDKGKELFTRRTLWNPTNWLRSKYDRKPFMDEIAKTETINRDEQGNRIPLGQIKLSDLKHRFMATSFNLCSQRTHFIKSWEKRHDKYRLIDVISWSALSAAYYFGKINVSDYEWCHFQPGCYKECGESSQSKDQLEDYKRCRYQPDNDSKNVALNKGAVFQDGGQGAHNNTLAYALMEAVANDWIKEDEDIYILSLGAGSVDQYVPYEKAERFNLLKQIYLHYLGQARNESIVDQVLATIHLSSYNPKIKFKRIDRVVKEAENGLDKVEYIEQYRKYGEELSEQLTDEDLKMFL